MSDERYCNIKCKPGELICDNRKACISELLFCDGNEDCPDNSDEAHCTNTVCPTDKFECWKSSTCISVEKICDNHKDCRDGEDEDMCLDMNSEQKAQAPVTVSSVQKALVAGQCGKNKFRCSNGGCISKTKVCNGRKDCKDGSDEIDCPKKIVFRPTCQPDQFHCGKGADGSKLCIPIQWVCDGKQDCPDGRDEMYCRLRSCPPGHFQCRNNVCIDQRLLCNNIDDCGDNSDEEKCEGYLRKAAKCMINEYKCKSGPCIPIKSVCDGIEECPHGDDELNCTKIHQCLQGEFQCAQTSICLPDSWVCDGIGDCPGESDEQNCPERTMKHKPCGEDSFVCGNGKCIPRVKMCNGHKDCRDGSDEHKWCGTCEKDNGGCPYKCRETAHGVECLCKEEWRLASLLTDGEKCQDEGACEKGTHHCRHYCHPVQGGYRCSCARGYMLEKNGETCKLEDQQIGRILFSTGNQLRAVSLNSKEAGADYSILFDAPDGRVLALDHDTETGKSYYSRESTVYYFDNKEHCLFGDFPGFVNVAVDWVTGNIYYLDETTATMGLCSKDGRFCTTFNSINLGLPRGIALHPKFGYAFVADWSNEACIMRIAMDGSSSMILHKEKLTWPNAVAIDFIRDRLYWVDAKHHLIESSRLDGSDRQVLTSGSVLHPFDLAVFDDRVFWSDWNLRAIMMIDMFNLTDQKPLRSFEEQPYGIAVDHPVFHNSTLENPCQNSHCSHLCALSPNDQSVGHPQAKCLCPNGYASYDDGRNCLPFTSRLSSTIRWCMKTFNDHCMLNSACQNGGTCRYQYDSQERLQQISCECPDYYKGIYCEVASGGLSANKRWGLLIAFIVCTTLVLVSFLIWKYRNQRNEFYRGLRKLESSQPIIRNVAQKIRKLSNRQDSSDRVHLTEPCKGLANPVYQEKQCFIRSNPLNSYDSAASTSYQA